MPLGSTTSPSSSAPGPTGSPTECRCGRTTARTTALLAAAVLGLLLLALMMPARAQISGPVQPSGSVAGPSGISSGNVTCTMGPVTRHFGGSDWAAIACSDHQSLMLYHGDGANQYTFTLTALGGVNTLRGQGQGDMQTVNAAQLELQALTVGQLLDLIAGVEDEWRTAPNNPANAPHHEANGTASPAPGTALPANSANPSGGSPSGVITRGN